MSGSQSSSWRQNDNWRPAGSTPTPTPTAAASQASASRWGEEKDNSHKRQFVPRQNPRQDRRQDDLDGAASDSIAEGRRIYLGNLLYRVKPDEIERVLAESGFAGKLEAIHISVDAVTGRNPGYCFLDFHARDDATAALEALGGTAIQGRPCKVGPCRPKGAEKRWKSDDYKPTFQRWGDWTGPRRSGFGRDGGAPLEGVEQGPYGAIEHLDDVRRAGVAPRVFLGGIGKMINQGEHDREIRGYLEGFKPVAISKRITPHPSTRAKPGNHHYCFVDFETMDEAEAAIKALNGRVTPAGMLRVQKAGSLPVGIQQMSTRS